MRNSPLLRDRDLLHVVEVLSDGVLVGGEGKVEHRHALGVRLGDVATSRVEAVRPLRRAGDVPLRAVVLVGDELGQGRCPADLEGGQLDPGWKERKIAANFSS